MKRLPLWLSIVAIVLAICAGLVGGYVLWNHPKVTTIAEDSFILSSNAYESMSEQEYEEYQKWLEGIAGYAKEEYWLCDLSLPFNRFGWYLNRFFLQESEVVEVIMRSDEPLEVSHVSWLSTCGVSFITISPGASNRTDNLFSSTLERVDGNWELKFTLKAERGGYYFLAIINETPDQIWYQYAVTLKS